MTIAVNNRTFVGISYLSLKRLSDGVVLTWPTPQNFVLNTGIEQNQQEGRDGLGRRVRTGVYTSAALPELSVTYNYVQPEMIGYTIGEEMVTGTFATSYPKLVQAYATDIPGDPVGGLLNGISADIDATASVIRQSSISTNLTRQPYATFVAATDDSFAIGADGALKFSDNLVAAKEVVSLLIPVSVTGTKISDILVGAHEMYATMIDTENKVVLFEAYNVAPNIGGKSINFGEANMELSFYVNNPPGGCRAWNLIDTGKTAQCSA